MALKSPLQFQLVLINLCLKYFFLVKALLRDKRGACVSVCTYMEHISSGLDTSTLVTIMFHT